MGFQQPISNSDMLLFYKTVGKSRVSSVFSSCFTREPTCTTNSLYQYRSYVPGLDKALAFMSNLEELVIDGVQPSSLGVKALQVGTRRTPGPCKQSRYRCYSWATVYTIMSIDQAIWAPISALVANK